MEGYTGMRSSKKAIEYLESRCIDYKLTDVAFNSGGLQEPEAMKC